jgi:hypothetical protein
MATGTYAPDIDKRVVDSNGTPVSGGLVWTYLAGTSTPVATYTDVALSVANTNPIVAGSDGRYVAFLTIGVSYKFVEETAATPPAHGSVIITRDNISAIPSTSNNVELIGTAGEALTAGQAVYLSDGSGSKNAGQWYKADSTQIYSSVVPEIGMVPSNIASGTSGTIRLNGQMTGLGSLSVGSMYYIGAAGALTTTAPVLRRLVGVADSVSTLVLTPNPSVPVEGWINDFRLTLTTAVPVTVSDVTAATTIYCSPLTGNRLDLPDSNGNPTRVTSAEFSIAVPASTSTMYDIFCYNNAGVATLELLAWTNDTTRATAVVRTTNGRLLKSGDNTRMLLGVFRTTGVSGQTEDSATKRHLWNYYNRDRRPLQRFETTATWTYSTATVRQANGSTTSNQVDVVVGWQDADLDLTLQGVVVDNTGAVDVSAGIGEDSTTTYAVGGTMHTIAEQGSMISALRLVKKPAVGRHFYSWNEWSQATGTTTWRANTASVGSTITAGLIGWIEG